MKDEVYVVFEKKELDGETIFLGVFRSYQKAKEYIKEHATGFVSINITEVQ